MDIKDMVPVKTSERHVILDALRGFALLGICLANFPEFSLYTFQKLRITEAMPTAEIDKVVRFLQYLFVDGKFYTIFSLLFGIGFSIIISNAAKKGAETSCCCMPYWACCSLFSGMFRTECCWGLPQSYCYFLFRLIGWPVHSECPCRLPQCECNSTIAIYMA